MASESLGCQPPYEERDLGCHLQGVTRLGILCQEMPPLPKQVLRVYPPVAVKPFMVKSFHVMSFMSCRDFVPATSVRISGHSFMVMCLRTVNFSWSPASMFSRLSFSNRRNRRVCYCIIRILVWVGGQIKYGMCEQRQGCDVANDSSAGRGTSVLGGRLLYRVAGEKLLTCLFFFVQLVLHRSQSITA